MNLPFPVQLRHSTNPLARIQTTTQLAIINSTATNNTSTLNTQ